MIVVGGEALVDLVPDPSTMDGELGPMLPRGIRSASATAGGISCATEKPSDG